MTAAIWAAAVLAWLGVDALIAACLLRRAAVRESETSWFDHMRFIDRVATYAPPATIVHPCSYGGDLLEYPIARGWDEAAILETLAEIEGL